MRLTLALALPITAILLTALALSGPPARLDAVYAPEDCRRVEIIDGLRRPIVGVEDMAAFADGTIIMSAYDRRFRNSPVRGIYLTSVLDLVDREPPVQVDSLRGPSAVVDGFYPHGLAIDRSGQRLAFVNRPEQGRAEVIWGALYPTGFEAEGRWDAPDACRANDLMFRGAELLVTRDRASCGVSFSDLMPGAASGSLVAVDAGGAREIETGLAFANGLELAQGRVIVAETRGDRLVEAGTGEAIELPGGPDNLTPGPLGSVLAALHTDLFDYWLFTLGYADDAPSRIVSISPRTGGIEVLYDDPLGKQISGASVALQVQGVLIAGAAYDRGLLVCTP